MWMQVSNICRLFILNQSVDILTWFQTLAKKAKEGESPSSAPGPEPREAPSPCSSREPSPAAPALESSSKPPEALGRGRGKRGDDQEYGQQEHGSLHGVSFLEIS